MKKSGRKGEISEVASQKPEAKQGVTSIQQLGYSNFQRQANNNVKRSSVRSLREAFENAIKGEHPARENGVASPPRDSPPRTESKRLSRFDLSRIPVKSRKPSDHDSGSKDSSDVECKVQTSAQNGKPFTVVSNVRNGKKVHGVVCDPVKPKAKADVVAKCKSETSALCDEIVIEKSDREDKNSATSVSQYPLSLESKAELISTSSAAVPASSIPVLTIREQREVEIPKSAKTTHNRLSASQLVIERLQQNLSTKLSPETIETLKRSYSPAVERKLRPSSLDSPKSPDYFVYPLPKSHLITSVTSKNSQNNKAQGLESSQPLSTRTDLVGNAANSVTKNNEDRLNNNSVPVREGEINRTCLKDRDVVEDTVLRKSEHKETITDEDGAKDKSIKKKRELTNDLPNGVSKINFVSSRKNSDTRPLSHPEHLLSNCYKTAISGGLESSFNSESSSLEEYFSSPELRNPRSRCSSALTDYSFSEEKQPKRVSWTTSLLQKLSQDRPAKKVKTVRKLRRGKLVRFPEEKTLSAEERFRLKQEAHAKKYAEHLPGIPKRIDKKIETQSVVDENRNTEPETALFVKRSDIVKDDDKDAYASLISKLAEEKDEKEEEKESAGRSLSTSTYDNEVSEKYIYADEHIDFDEKEKQLLASLASDSDYSDLSDPEIIHAFVVSEKSYLENQERARKTATPDNLQPPSFKNISGLSEGEISGERNHSVPEIGILTPTGDNTSITEVNSITCEENQTNITAATKETPQGGKRSQEEKEKPSGFRKLFFHNIFSSPKRHTADDRKISSQETVQLLKKEEQPNYAQKQIKSKYIGDSKVHPSTNKPILETAFLTNIPKKEVRSQASTPEIYGIQKQSNSSQIQNDNSQRNLHLRSRSLSPNSSRGRFSAEPQLSPNRTIPDTSLIIEERLQKLRHENQPPKRPSSTPLKPSRQEELFHRNNSMPSRMQQPSYPKKRTDSPSTPTNELPNNYHAYQNYANANKPSSRQSQAKKSVDETDEGVRSRNSISSCSSSSTIVPQESPVPWNSALTDSEQHVSAGRKGQDRSKAATQVVFSSPHFRHSVPAPETKYKEIRRGPVVYHPSEPTKYSGVPVTNLNEPFRVQNVSVSSGRLSAPLHTSHYAKPRIIPPETNNSRATLNKNGQCSQPNTNVYSNSGLLIPAYMQPKHLSPELKLKEESLRSRSLSPHYQRLPGGTYANVPSPLARDVSKTLTNKEREAVYQHLRARSISPLSSYSPESSGSSPGQPNFTQKLSRQEVEALYWEACRRRSTSQQLSPVSDPRLQGQYTSTGSLPGHAQRKVEQPVLIMRQQDSMGSLGGSAQLARPQPIYQNSTMTNQSPVLVQQRSGRSRSVSPGPNLRGLAGRSLSLPRHVPSALSVIPQAEQNVGQGYFERGSTQRSTIGPIHMHRQQSAARSTPTIYEEANNFSSVELRHPEKLAQVQGSERAPYPRSQSAMDVGTMSRDPNRKSGHGTQLGSDQNKTSEPFYHPIFKRGSLISNSTSSVDGALTDSSTYAIGPPPPPKRVSFTNQQQSRERSYWPTRNGLAPEPPTRQKRSARADSDSEVFLPNSPVSPKQPGANYDLYVNVSPSGQRGVKPAPPVRNVPLALQAPDRPLPPIPRNGAPQPRRAAEAVRQQPGEVPTPANRWQLQSESESGSEAGEVQRIMQRAAHRGAYYGEEEWGGDGKTRGQQGSEQSGGGGGRDEEVRRGGGGRSGRRDEPRRHTLSGDHHQQHQGGPLARSMDLEMSSKSQRRKSPLPRGYPPPSSAMLFDDDPGIMSEVETSSTGFRRGGKQRSSLPVVRTPSKTLERPLGKTPPPGAARCLVGQHAARHSHHLSHHLSNRPSPPTPDGGLVFLQYRNETKRALLPNEITSIDTVKALFVRSFPKQLTMEYLDSPHVKIYIHDSSKDMFYELEDHRSHLRDIRDRSVLRLFEAADVNGGVLPGAGVGVMAPSMWDQDQSYFSEPEFDSEYQHQHIHKSKASSKSSSSGGPPQPYYMTHSYPPGGPGAPATLPRGGPLLRAYSPAVVPPVPAERIKTLPQTGEQPPPKPVRTYQQHGLAKGSGPPVPDRLYGSFISPTNRREAVLYAAADRLHAESGYMSSPERGGSRAYPGAYGPGAPGYEDPYYSQYASRSGSITPVIDEEASDTELIDESYSLYGVKLPAARTVAPQPRSQFPAPAVVPYDATRIRVEHMERQLANLTGLVQKALTQTPTPREYLQVPAPSRDANFRNDKSVSFEKSVSFSDEPPDMNSPKQHSPQHAERMERERHKPAPPPKPVSLSPGQYEGRHVYRDLQLTPEMYNQLRGLQKKAKDLRQEVRNLRRMSQAQAHTVRETIRDTFIKIRAMLLSGGEEAWASTGDAEKIRLSRDEDSYKQEMLRLEKDLTELESTVEELRSNVINRKTRVNMSDVENMALILSKSSKTVADLKVRFPNLSEGMKSMLSSEMEKVVREEKFLKEEPERLESALRRCKKLTGTLVTLKRLASVQEQRLPPSGTPDSRLSPTLGADSDTPITPPAHGKPSAVSAGGVMASALGSDGSLSRQRPENALDALLDELQTFARPPSNPPVAEIGRKGSVDSAHPGPAAGACLRRLHSYPSGGDGGPSPPAAPLARLQVSGEGGKPPVPERSAELLAGRRVPPPPPPRTSSRSPLASPTGPCLPPRARPPRDSDPLSASNSSSCESVNSQEGARSRQQALEQRHQELLRKQRALQEQYARLQQLQRGSAAVPDLLLKKTGSESNLLARMGLGPGLSAAAPMSGSLSSLAVTAAPAAAAATTTTTTTATTSKIYETDIL
ncbi:uncharacterized protein LOC134542024 isoform X5 [Bacillus rossius redtenbacheri]|uniref:uncharacterized protein LOC134542024 isoform X5 n=1 Tax=Bacillus rossius redtenbacheri TaxID=93214 RepID=UPI002FDEA06D